MNFDTSLDTLRTVASIAIGVVAIFLSWALYELAKLLHQTNEAVGEAREKIARVEMAIHSIKERLEHSVRYLGILAEGGKTILSYLMTRDAKKPKKGKKADEDEDEVEADD